MRIDVVYWNVNRRKRFHLGGADCTKPDAETLLETRAILQCRTLFTLHAVRSEPVPTLSVDQYVFSEYPAD